MHSAVIGSIHLLSRPDVVILYNCPVIQRRDVTPRSVFRSFFRKPSHHVQFAIWQLRPIIRRVQTRWAIHATIVLSCGFAAITSLKTHLPLHRRLISTTDLFGAPTILTTSHDGFHSFPLPHRAVPYLSSCRALL